MLLEDQSQSGRVWVAWKRPVQGLFRWIQLLVPHSLEHLEQAYDFQGDAGRPSLGDETLNEEYLDPQQTALAVIESPTVEQRYCSDDVARRLARQIGSCRGHRRFPPRFRTQGQPLEPLFLPHRPIRMLEDWSLHPPLFRCVDRCLVQQLPAGDYQPLKRSETGYHRTRWWPGIARQALRSSQAGRNGCDQPRPVVLGL